MSNHTENAEVPSLTRDQIYAYIFNDFRKLSQDKKKILARTLYIFNPKHIKETSAGLVVNLSDINDMMLRHIYNFIKVNIYAT